MLMTDRMGYERDLLGVCSPHSIVEDAKLLMRGHLAESLTLEHVAKALIIKPADLRACFRLVVNTSFDAELTKMRLNALYELMRASPAESLDALAARVGLELSDALSQAFEEAFWISLQEHHQHCRQCGAQLPT